MSADVPLPPLGSIGPWRAGEGELKTQKNWGVVSFMQWTATISNFRSASKCGSICRAETCTHSGVEPSTSAKAILQGGRGGSTLGPGGTGPPNVGQAPPNILVPTAKICILKI